MKDGFPVSVAELIATGARPLPGEAVAILLDVCEQVVRRPAGGVVLPAITPSALFLDGSGAVTLAGGVPAEDDQTVQLLGRLLVQILPPPGTADATRVPSRLRDIATRAAAGEFERLSVARLAATLRRFAPEQSQTAVRALVERFRDGTARGPAPATDFSVEPNLSRAEGAAGAPLRRASFRRTRRRLVGALVGVLLILASVGAAYWLNADTSLPPVPLSPSLLSQPSAPSRGGWELLDPAGLAVEARPLLPSSEPAPADRVEKSPPSPQPPEAASHKPVQ